jgi:hypothetical protein
MKDMRIQNLKPPARTREPVQQIMTARAIHVSMMLFPAPGFLAMAVESVKSIMARLTAHVQKAKSSTLLANAS